MVSPYKVLGIGPDADEDDIEQAYRDRVKETHPDHGGSRSEFRLVKTAYEELTAGESPRASDDSVDRGQSESAGKTDQPSCHACDRTIQDIRTAVRSENPDRLYCESCIVDTHCHVCGDELLLRPEQAAEVGPEPVCLSCGRETTRSDDPGPRTDGFLGRVTRTVAGIAFYLVAGAVLTIVGFFVLDVLAPALAVPDGAGSAAGAVVGPGVLVVLLWLSRRD